MSEASFDTKLKVAAKAFFRDGHGDPEYPFSTWEEQYEEFKKPGMVSDAFIETCYQMNKDDPELNLEADKDLN